MSTGTLKPTDTKSDPRSGKKYKYPGIPVTTNGGRLVALYVESLIADAGIFYPITPSTEMGEVFEGEVAKGSLNAFGQAKIAIETEGEHAAQGGAIAYSVAGRRVVNFTSGQGVVYGLEQYYHAPGKLSTMVVELGARALTKHALNVHCGHDDFYAAIDTGWTILFGKDAQQAADQALILRKVNELTLNPGINGQDGFIVTHLERTFLRPEAELVREFLGRSDDMIDCPTEAQRQLFGPKRRRVPKLMDLERPILLGPVQNQEHYMNGVAARRNNFSEHVLKFLEDAYQEFGRLTGRQYGLISEYNCEFTDTVFVAIGSAAENIEAANEYLRESRGEEFGCIHINVIRPFPEAAVVNALKGKKNVIILERSDDQLSGDNVLTRDIRNALNKALENSRTLAYDHLPTMTLDEMPRIFSSVYGLGSRDFRPEHVLGAYDYVKGRIGRQDGRHAADGESFFYLGVDHPYSVISKETPSCLPNLAIAVRFHSIGGWGMITTGKNLGGILGEFSGYIAKRDNLIDPVTGTYAEAVHLSANPKYGSEKKGAPTEYFLVAAPERIKVNCDLRHVNVVLCCDPKAFTHCDPLDGMAEGGAFVWESSEKDPAKVWERIPLNVRKQIVAKKIKLYTLPGFDIAREATDREDLQLRMQGNAFLGAFFGVSSFLKDNKIPKEEFLATVRGQYEKKFGRFGAEVVESNMLVMKGGFERVHEIPYGEYAAADHSSMRGPSMLPFTLGAGCGTSAPGASSCSTSSVPMFSLKSFDGEYRAGLGYHQPASPLSSVGVIAAGSGATASKYVARRETPVFIPENCTQCMACISACPDTALPNTAQHPQTILKTAVLNYVQDDHTRTQLIKKLADIDTTVRAKMNAALEAKDTSVSFVGLVNAEIETLASNGLKLKRDEVDRLKSVIEKLPLAYSKVNQIFKSKEKKEPGSGGLFGIFVSDLCKGCGECVQQCGDHEALKMVVETEDVNGKHITATNFLNLLPDTPQEYLGLYIADSPDESRTAALQNHLMQRSKYDALVSGDGACAGCGEKTILRGIMTLTESYMRPVFHRKADRLRGKAADLLKNGVKKLADLKGKSPESYSLLRGMILHLVLGEGRESIEATKKHIAANVKTSDKDLVEALAAVMEQDAFNHRNLKTLEGKNAEGMSVVAMAAHTGCNTVYGSTPPNNPHPYPWMNSLFQDGATIGWLLGESFLIDHARRSVIPERFCDAILTDTATALDDNDWFEFSCFRDNLMTDAEIQELPKVWVVGGDGGMGDIGFQNVSKVVLQNRPNIKMIMVDTQVYSNTGGQSSDSSVITGGFDFNQFGRASQGKMSEMKSAAEAFLGGHGSPYLARVSMANSANLFRGILDALTYRGTAFIQSFTTCQPEHGVADWASTLQAQRIRDSRGLPEFTQNPGLGESMTDTLSVKGNPNSDRDWYTPKHPETGERYQYTVAQWGTTEARFRNHLKQITKEETAKYIHLDDMILRLTQDDIVNRRMFRKDHRAFIPDFGVWFMAINEGKTEYYLCSRHMVIFCVERRKAWRMLQSKAGVVNVDYVAQKALLKDFDEGKIDKADFFSPKIQDLLEERRAATAKA